MNESGRSSMRLLRQEKCKSIGPFTNCAVAITIMSLRPSGYRASKVGMAGSPRVVFPAVCAIISIHALAIIATLPNDYELTESAPRSGRSLESGPPDWQRCFLGMQYASSTRPQLSLLTDTHPRRMRANRITGGLLWVSVPSEEVDDARPQSTGPQRPATLKRAFSVTESFTPITDRLPSRRAVQDLGPLPGEDYCQRR
jgi:hypothetical protein